MVVLFNLYCSAPEDPRWEGIRGLGPKQGGRGGGGHGLGPFESGVQSQVCALESFNMPTLIARLLSNKHHEL